MSGSCERWQLHVWDLSGKGNVQSQLAAAGDSHCSQFVLVHIKNQLGLLGGTGVPVQLQLLACETCKIDEETSPCILWISIFILLQQTSLFNWQQDWFQIIFSFLKKSIKLISKVYIILEKWKWSENHSWNLSEWNCGSIWYHN